MSLNLTAATLEARLSPTLLCFSRTVTTGTVALLGPGGAEGDGFPVDNLAVATQLAVYDGETLRTGRHTLSLGDTDRVSLLATYIDPTYTVSLVVNGFLTPLQVSGCRANSLLQATLTLYIGKE